MSRSVAAVGPRRWSLWSIAVAALFPLGAVAFHRPIGDNSFLWHIRAGDIQIDQGAVLTEDPFSFTALRRPWRTQSWLVELGYGWLEPRIGLSLAPVIVTLCWLVFLVALLAIVRRHLHSVAQTALVATMTVFVVIGFFNPRPVVFSFVLICLLVLSDRDPRLRWAAPLIMWVWAAVHGSFVVGGAYLLIQMIRFRDKSRLPMVLAGSAGTLATAHGLGILLILKDFAGGGEALDLMAEWGTPDLLSLPFFPVLPLIGLMLYAATRGVVRSRDLWLVSPMLVLLFEANRTVPAAWLFLLPIASKAVAETIPWSGRSQVSRWPVLVGGLALFAGVVFLAPPTRLDPERFPLSAAAFLTGERVFASDGAGGYLIYAKWPERLVYVDDRAELFGEELPEMVKVRGGDPIWDEVFEERGFDEALVSVEDPLADLLRMSGWSESFRDENWIALRR